MSDTKACNLTENEIKTLIRNYGIVLNDPYEENNRDGNIERINYLNKRLKSFKEVEVIQETGNKEPAKSW